jgi:hypothetical protein
MTPADVEHSYLVAVTAFDVAQTLAQVEITPEPARSAILVRSRRHLYHSLSRTMMTPVLM